MIATNSSSWWPFAIMAIGGTAWAVLCMSVAARFEKHDGPLSFAVIPVFVGLLALAALVEVWW